MDAIWIALIVAIPTAVAAATPLTVGYLTARAHRQDRREDWVRQDQVAARLEARQEAAARKTAEVARLLVQTDKRAAVTAEAIDGKLNQIHELVNSTLTGAIEAQLLATEQQVILMRRLTEVDPKEGDRDRIAEIELRVAELRTRLADRATQTVIADAQVTAGS